MIVLVLVGRETLGPNSQPTFYFVECLTWESGNSQQVLFCHFHNTTGCIKNIHVCPGDRVHQWIWSPGAYRDMFFKHRVVCWLTKVATHSVYNCQTFNLTLSVLINRSQVRMATLLPIFVHYFFITLPPFSQINYWYYLQNSKTYNDISWYFLKVSVQYDLTSFVTKQYISATKNPWIPTTMLAIMSYGNQFSGR
jgi:hypothetical protein